MATLRWLLIVSLYPVAVRPSTAQPSDPSFANLRAVWTDALEHRRLEQSLALYTADATFMSSDGSHAQGAAELRNLYSNVFSTFAATIKLTPRVTRRSASLAFESGSYAEALSDQATGATLHLAGDYLTIYRLDLDRHWRIVQQVWTGAPPLK